MTLICTWYAYNNIIKEPKEVLARKIKLVSAPDHIGSSFDLSSSSDGLLFTSTKAYFDEWFRKILVDSYTRETCIHDHIYVVANEADSREENITEEAKAIKAKILGELTLWKMS